MKNYIKKLFVLLAIIFSVTFVTSFSNPVPAYADDGGLGSCRPLLGMTSWDCGINPNPSNEEDLKDNAITIAVNVFTDIGVIATYLAIGYIIYGGYLYMFSSGDPSKVIIGRKTLVRAFIGLGIVMLSGVILNTIRLVLLGQKDFASCSGLDTECVNVSSLVRNVIDWFIGVSSIVAVIFVVLGGIGYMTSQGDPGKLQKAKNTILYALIGLIVVALSRVILGFVYNLIDQSTKNTSYIESSISQKY